VIDPADRATRPARDRLGKIFGVAFSGAMFGCMAIGVVSGVMGVWPLFFAFPLFTAHMVLSALAGAAAAATLARRWRRELSAIAIMAIAGALTFALFAALPLCFVLLVPGRAGGLLFG
jgi:hypothetical protein